MAIWDWQNLYTIIKQGLKNSICLVSMENLDYRYHSEKKDIYENAGVEEYWIVAPRGNRLISIIWRTAGIFWSRVIYYLYGRELIQFNINGFDSLFRKRRNGEI